MRAGCSGIVGPAAVRTGERGVATPASQWRGARNGPRHGLGSGERDTMGRLRSEANRIDRVDALRARAGEIAVIPSERSFAPQRPATPCALRYNSPPCKTFGAA